MLDDDAHRRARVCFQKSNRIASLNLRLTKLGVEGTQALLEVGRPASCRRLIGVCVSLLLAVDMCVSVAVDWCRSLDCCLKFDGCRSSFFVRVWL